MKKLVLVSLLICAFALSVPAQNPGPGAGDGKCPGNLCSRPAAAQAVKKDVRVPFIVTAYIWIHILIK